MGFESIRNLTHRRKLGVMILIYALVIGFLGLFYLNFGHYKIPAASMKPTLVVGDHVFVSKLAYGFSRHALPPPLQGAGEFQRKEKDRTHLPKRGDVVVFRNPNTNIVMIKRVIGLPGDVINISVGRYSLNNNLIERELVERLKFRDDRNKAVTNVLVYEEQFPGEKEPHFIYEISDRRPFDNAGEFRVPDGHFFVLGDHRDNSIDSRAPVGNSQQTFGPGYIPLNLLIGRAEFVMFSFSACKKEEGFHCPKRRFLSPI